MGLFTDRAASRQAVYQQVYADFGERFGASFCNGDPDFDDPFLDELAQRWVSQTVEGIGAGLCPEDPPDWVYREREAWIFSMGPWGFRALANQNRKRLIGTAVLLGLDEHVRSWGIEW